MYLTGSLHPLQYGVRVAPAAGAIASPRDGMGEGGPPGLWAAGPGPGGPL